MSPKHIKTNHYATVKNVLRNPTVKVLALQVTSLHRFQYMEQNHKNPLSG